MKQITKRLLMLFLVFCMTGTALLSQTKSTLRIDCIFSGNASIRHIALAKLSDAGPWAGRTVNMDTLALRGNGRIELRDAESSRLLYTNSFSTLFQEWQATEEATMRTKSFENVFLVPMPEDSAVISIDLYDLKGNPSSSMSFAVSPSDILIYRNSIATAPHKYLLKSGAIEDKIDLAIVADGYTAEEAELFYEDAEKAIESIFSYSPFREMKDRFNVVAVALPSSDSGISVPRDGLWLDTALGSHFDTFYMDRYLTTLNLFKLHDSLSGIPYEHIIILANTDTYGGGGIFNSYLLSAAHNEWTSPVVVHEFGHSFAGLADEYFYDDMYSEYYFPDVETWEPNITTLKDFCSKWQDMLPVDAKPVSKADQAVNPDSYGYSDGEPVLGIYEGAGYQSEGVYRPYPVCRMRVNDYPSFCPVCERAIRRIIDFYTVQDPNLLRATRD